MTAPITGSMLRDLVQCERRVHHDLRSGPEGRDPVSDFVRMLWEGGVAHEGDVLAKLSGEVADFRDLPPAMQAAATADAVSGTCDWILGARLEIGDRLGRPDLLHRFDGLWYAGDVKSGTPWTGEDGAAKVEYGVQVGHYAVLLEELGLGCGDRAFVVGRDGELAWYDLDRTSGRDRASLRERVAGLVEDARRIRDGASVTRAALSAMCGLCHWRTVCRAELRAADDLTLIAGLGRSLRSSMEAVAPTVAALADLDVGGAALPGVGAERLARFRDRARLLRDRGSAYAREGLGLRRYARELHFDIEADPMSDGLVYLHGILVRETAAGTGSEEFVHFLADDAEGEGRAFADAFAFLTGDPSAHVFYYSKFERTAYRSLQARHPWVCSPEDVERLFDPARSTDLYFDVVAARTEWPLSSYGIKAVAKHLGFAWRDADASGAASIAWFHEYRASRDPAVRRRILEYNEDDCRATAVLLDALLELPIGPPTQA